MLLHVGVVFPCFWKLNSAIPINIGNSAGIFQIRIVNWNSGKGSLHNSHRAFSYYNIIAYRGLSGMEGIYCAHRTTIRIQNDGSCTCQQR